MVQIKKGNKILTVPNSSFKETYKKAGWELVEKKKENKKESKNIQEESTNAEESTEDSEWDEDSEWEEEEEVSKPISEMNNAELRKHAEKNGIDITGLTTNKQLREAIRAAM